MTHRGGIAADGKTGDGCGLLLQMPDDFMRRVAQDNFSEELTESYGVGMVFLSQDEDKAAHSRNVLNQAIEDNGLEVVGWREVPVDPSLPWAYWRKLPAAHRAGVCKQPRSSGRSVRSALISGS